MYKSTHIRRHGRRNMREDTGGHWKGMCEKEAEDTCLEKQGRFRLGRNHRITEW